MANRYLVGIDVGTTGTKTIIFDCQGRIAATGYTEYSCHYPQPNWVEQDAEELIEAVFATNRQALKNASATRAPTVASTSVTNGVRIR